MYIIQDFPIDSTCWMGCLEAFPLYWGIREKDDIHPIHAGLDLWRGFASAKLSQKTSIIVYTVKQLNVVVQTFLMRLQLEIHERDLDAVSGGATQQPHAVLPTGVEVRVVRAVNFSCWVVNVVFAATCIKGIQIIYQGYLTYYFIITVIC